MSEQTDTIEAVAREKLRDDLDEATKQHMPAMVVTTDYLRSVLDTIAALRAEIERLTQREAIVREECVRAGIEAARETLKTVPTDKAALWDVNAAIRALDAEAIAKEATRAAALSDLIAECAFFLDLPDTLGDSDGDDGA